MNGNVYERGLHEGLVFEHGPIALGEFPVEPAVVRDDNDRVFGEGRDGGIVEFVSGNHFVGDAGECRHFRGDRRTRLVEGGERVADAGDAAVLRVSNLTIPSSMISSLA